MNFYSELIMIGNNQLCMSKEAQQRRTGGQGLETRPPSGPAGTGPKIEYRKGGGLVQGMAEEGRNLEGRTHRGRQRRYQLPGRWKGGDQTGEEAS